MERRHSRRARVHRARAEAHRIEQEKWKNGEIDRRRSNLPPHWSPWAKLLGATAVPATVVFGLASGAAAGPVAARPCLVVAAGPGDTVAALAYAWGLNWRDMGDVWVLAQANPWMANPNVLAVGERVTDCPTSEPPAPVPNVATHVLLAGESLVALEDEATGRWHHPLAVWRLAQANPGLVAPYGLPAGTVVHLLPPDPPPPAPTPVTHHAAVPLPAPPRPAPVRPLPALPPATLPPDPPKLIGAPEETTPAPPAPSAGPPPTTFAPGTTPTTAEEPPPSSEAPKPATPQVTVPASVEEPSAPAIITSSPTSTTAAAPPTTTAQPAPPTPASPTFGAVAALTPATAAPTTTTAPTPPPVAALSTLITSGYAGQPDPADPAVVAHAFADLAADDPTITPQGAAWIVGGFIQESGLDPSTGQPGGPPGGDGGAAVGIAQWHEPRHCGEVVGLDAQVACAAQEIAAHYPTVQAVISDPNATPAALDEAERQFEGYGKKGRRGDYARGIAAQVTGGDRHDRH